MKAPLLFTFAATALLLGGCSVFQSSPTWDLVVRANSSGFNREESKAGYLERMHRLLAEAGVEHKVVTYQYRWFNGYHEEAIQSSELIVYRDDTTPSNPWWITDEYRRIPVWVPNASLDYQVGFFIHQKAEVVSVKEFAARPTSEKQLAQLSREDQRALAKVRPGSGARTLFAGSAPRLKVAKRPAPAASKKIAVQPQPPRSREAVDTALERRAIQAFRSAHGTSFNPHSSVDREKLNELRRRLFARNQIVRLRAE